MSVARSATSGTSTVPDVVLFTVGRQALGAHDLIGLASADGRWQRVESRAARALGARDVAGEVPLDAVRAAERAFRYARGLVAAEEVEAWLRQFGLSVGGWREHVRREVALDRHPDAAPADVDADAVWLTACCTDLLATIAGEQARRVAAAAALGQPTDQPGPEAVARFLADAVDDAAIDRELSDNAMDWLRVRFAVLTASTRDAAAEARLCLTDDGMSPAQVADLLGSPLVEREIWMRDAPEGLGDVLLTTEIGGASDPVASDIGVDVVTVSDRERRPPSDPEVRTAVREVLAERALQRQVEDRVRWHVTF